MSTAPAPGPAVPGATIRPGRYRHYKGQEYRVLGAARHSETGEALVLYQALYGEGGWWARPAGMFLESVPAADGARVPRFRWIADS